MKSFAFFSVSTALISLTATAQTWQVVDTFENGQAQATWVSKGTPAVDTSNGYLDLRISSAGNNTSTLIAELPDSFSSGKFTVAFDYYLPSGSISNETGFGAASTAMLDANGWNPIGADNRFQMVGDYPQNLAKVPEWTTDIFGTTEQGVWYNIWLVYDLSADPNTITAVTKKASDPMEAASLTSATFDFADRGNGDDWSEITHFGFGIGFIAAIPDVQEIDDSLGALADNIYVSAGENLTLTPTSYEQSWEVVDLFNSGGPDATWTADPAITATFDEGSVLVTASGADKGLYTELPVSSIRSAFTVAFDMLLPAGGINNIAFSVVGSDQIAQTGPALFGTPDHFVSFGTQQPQTLANWGQLGQGLLSPNQQDTWYHVWLVYDYSRAEVDFYAVPKADPVDSVTLPTAPQGTFALEDDYLDMNYLVLGSSTQNFNGAGLGFRVDNIYQSLGSVVALSPTAGEMGGGSDPVSLWAEVAADTYGFKASGIGLIYDDHYPYVWHDDLGGYVYIAPDQSSLTDIYGYDYTNEFWFWTSNELGGWHFNIEDSSYGVSGWAAW